MRNVFAGLEPKYLNLSDLVHREETISHLLDREKAFAGHLMKTGHELSAQKSLGQPRYDDLSGNTYRLVDATWHFQNLAKTGLSLYDPRQTLEAVGLKDALSAALERLSTSLPSFSSF